MVDDCTRKPTRLVLLDRDGVINHDSPEYIKSPAEWRPISGALAAIARLNTAGLHVALCTNQSGIARGLFSPRDLAAIHVRLALELSRHSGHLNLVRFCPHIDADACNCRKPAPGMLLDCMTEFGVAPEETVFIGDSPSDVAAARAATCEAAFVRTGYGSEERLRNREAQARELGANLVADSLADVVDSLLQQSGNPTGSR